MDESSHNGQQARREEGEREMPETKEHARRRSWIRTIRPDPPAVRATPAEGQIELLDFCQRAIRAWRTHDPGGIHARYSGFNKAFKRYYGKDTDPVWEVEELVLAGKLDIRLCKGGAMIYLAGERQVDMLEKMGLEAPPEIIDDGQSPSTPARQDDDRDG